MVLEQDSRERSSGKVLEQDARERRSGKGEALRCWIDTKGCRNVNWFRGGLVFKTHRLVYHSTLGLRVIKKKKT